MIVVPALLALGFVVVGTARFRLHPFVALLVAAFGLGLGSGMPTSDVARHAAEGFGSTASAIGVVIAAGALIGVVLEATGGAEALATGTLAAVGERFALIAVGLAGLLVGVPVFCDSGFVLLAPVVRRLAVRAGERREVALVMLSMGLYMTHVLVPPTPGPVAAAGALGVDLSRMIALGFFVALPALAAVRAYARWASGSAPEAPEPSAVLGSSESGAPSAVTDAARPPGFARALAPILLPVLLLAVRSWALPFKTASSGAVFAFVEFLGHPWVALFVGAAVAFVALGWSARARWLAWSEDALRIAGPIVLITAAGGAFGGVLRATSLTGLLSGVAGAAPAGTLALVIPFVVAALLKTGVGS
ncbi:MAG: GntP family permease, partial [Myxococcales bacterium]|nr:GntP family permease [Myxococcales bacterium]